MMVHRRSTAELWLTHITRTEDDTAVTTAYEAEQALRAAGWEYDAIEEEDAELGLWLVGLLGTEADLAHRGDYVDGEAGGYSLEVPQV
jgi:hypothetical protein